ncbi:MAG: T9SS type A sorting domain-containing protein, partial [Bacteroidota bacterium]|nr:T9SS type A sorting domain-containing protein [Bacteroidota bacterium]
VKSTAAATAAVADLTNNDVNTGNQVLGAVTAERYLAAFKKWRFLSIPTSTAQTIKAAWQEGCGANSNCISGYGTQITGAGGIAAGFDVYSASPSMKTYVTATDSWLAIPNTTSSINNPANNTVAYFVFIRGDRGATTVSNPVTPTTLRTKGVIKQGVQSAITIAAPATAYTSVGNPYPSTIDLRKMTPAPTTATKIYVWDPLATVGSAYGYGAYQTLTFDGSNFSVTPGGGSYDPPYNKNPNYIESGEAFFMGGRASAYSVTFKEDIKPSGASVIASANVLQQSIKADLYVNSNGLTALMDGTKADIGENFSDKLDDDDAYKITNSTETVSLKRSGKLLGVERHYSIVANDTFYLNVTNYKIQNYQWRLNLTNLTQPGLTAFMQDSYKKTSIRINPDGITTLNFNIENIAGSYVADRFRIVFTPALVLPVTFTSIKAYKYNTNINVEWKVDNELDMKEYDVEHSADGNKFTHLVTTAATENSGRSASYAITDGHPFENYNYYRIKSIDLNGKAAYTNIVKVLMGKTSKEISVYPNPVTNGVIGLQLSNQPEGKYRIELINKAGQVIMAKQINHEEGSSIENIVLDKYTVHGMYQLKVTTPSGEVKNIQVLY